MSRKSPIVYLPIAEQDLTEIIDYIRADNPVAAMNLLEDIDKAVSMLDVFPNMGHIPKDYRLKRLGYRFLVVGNYLIFYVVTESDIEIRRFLHGKRKYSFLI